MAATCDPEINYPFGSPKYRAQRRAYEDQFTDLWETAGERLKYKLMRQGVQDYEEVAQDIGLWGWRHMADLEGHTVQSMVSWLWSFAYRPIMRERARQSRDLRFSDLACGEDNPQVRAALDGREIKGTHRFPDHFYSGQDALEDSITSMLAYLAGPTFVVTSDVGVECLNHLHALVGVSKLSLVDSMQLSALVLLADQVWGRPEGTYIERRNRYDLSRMMLKHGALLVQADERAEHLGISVRAYWRRHTDLQQAIAIIVTQVGACVHEK